MRVTKHDSKSEHDWPMQFSLAAETSRQKSTTSGMSATSARSPVCGLRRPGLDRAVDGQLLEAAEAPRLREGREAEQAQVVRPALHHRRRSARGRGPGPGSGCPSGRAAPAGSSCRWRRRRGAPARPRAAGTRASCRCRCRPRRAAGRRRRAPRPPPRTASAARAAPRSRGGRARAGRCGRRSWREGSRPGDVSSEDPRRRYDPIMRTTLSLLLCARPHPWPWPSRDRRPPCPRALGS